MFFHRLNGKYWEDKIMRRVLVLCLLGIMVVALSGCLFNRTWWKKTFRTVTSDVEVAFSDLDHIILEPSKPDHGVE